MGLLDFIFGNSKKKEEKRLAMERQAEQERQRKEEDARLAKKREQVEAKNKRKQEAKQRQMEQQEKKRLEKLANNSSRNFGSPIYKEDQYSQMIRSTVFNPFRLTCESSLNANLKFGNMVDVFKQELARILPQARSYGMPLDQALSGYIFNMIESYYKNAGYVPKAIADSIIEQVYTAVKQTAFANIVDNVNQLKDKTYWDLTHN